jgi:hypothetical protein
MPSSAPTRRAALKTTLAFSASLTLGLRSLRAEDAVAANVEKAHAEIWRRFIDPHGILLDYTDIDGAYPRSTPAECRDGKPNALAWWTPTENGSMFDGMYLDAACARWRLTGAAADREKARRLMKGLLLLASLGPPGFIARGVATDGRTPYPMGSDDQTGPWLYGLWRYTQDGLADPAERAAIVAKFAEIARVLESTHWRLPCNEGAPSPFRGSFAGHAWQNAPRLLFLLKAAHHLTGDAHWDEVYRQATREKGGQPETTRVEVCARGMVFHGKSRESWTGASSAIALRGLWEMETDPDLRNAYARGLAASAQLAAEGVALSRKFDNDARQTFLQDWRVLNEWWQPQHSEEEAVAVAMAQVKELGRLSPRRYQEFTFVREPLFAAWVVTLCPDRALVASHRDAILETLGHYDYTRLYYSQFFPAEAAWYRLQSLADAF